LKKNHQKKGGMDIPFTVEEKHYNYRCGECGYEQEVPYFVVDEFAAIEGLGPGNMPVLECGSCGGELKCVD